MSTALENKAMPCDYCGQTGHSKARASSGGEIRLFCHTADLSCYNNARGLYFTTCTCDKQSNKALWERYDSWCITRADPKCEMHRSNRVTLSEQS